MNVNQETQNLSAHSGCQKISVSALIVQFHDPWCDHQKWEVNKQESSLITAGSILCPRASLHSVLVPKLHTLHQISVIFPCFYSWIPARCWPTNRAFHKLYRSLGLSWVVFYLNIKEAESKHLCVAYYLAEWPAHSGMGCRRPHSELTCGRMLNEALASGVSPKF